MMLDCLGELASARFSKSPIFIAGGSRSCSWSGIKRSFNNIEAPAGHEITLQSHNAIAACALSNMVELHLQIEFTW
jgi:hypothetical protein